MKPLTVGCLFLGFDSREKWTQSLIDLLQSKQYHPTFSLCTIEIISKSLLCLTLWGHPKSIHDIFEYQISQVLRGHGTYCSRYMLCRKSCCFSTCSRGHTAVSTQNHFEKRLLVATRVIQLLDSNHGGKTYREEGRNLNRVPVARGLKFGTYLITRPRDPC